MTDNHHKIHYIELPSIDLAKSKAFYGAVFGWEFVDYGPHYVGLTGAGIDGGFEHVSQSGRDPSTSGALVIIYTDNQEASTKAVIAAGGKITKPTFEFPGGKRFHFTDLSGNELAAWTLT